MFPTVARMTMVAMLLKVSYGMQSMLSLGTQIKNASQSIWPFSSSTNETSRSTSENDGSPEPSIKGSNSESEVCEEKTEFSHPLEARAEPNPAVMPGLAGDIMRAVDIYFSEEKICLLANFCIPQMLSEMRCAVPPPKPTWFSKTKDVETYNRVTKANAAKLQSLIKFCYLLKGRKAHFTTEDKCKRRPGQVLRDRANFLIDLFELLRGHYVHNSNWKENKDSKGSIEFLNAFNLILTLAGTGVNGVGMFFMNSDKWKAMTKDLRTFWKDLFNAYWTKKCNKNKETMSDFELLEIAAKAFVPCIVNFVNDDVKNYVDGLCVAAAQEKYKEIQAGKY